MQLSTDVLATTLQVSLAHVVQVALPDTDLYVPATHAVQGPPICPVYPALQVQVLIDNPD